MGLINYIREKLNPAQSDISVEEGPQSSDTHHLPFDRAFNNIEAVNRGVSMIINGCCSLDYDVGDKVITTTKPKVKAAGLKRLLNFRPNPYQSAQEFRSAIFKDIIFDGHAFIYFDGAFIYHLPAHRVEIVPSEKTYIAGYRYNEKPFDEEEVFSFKDINSDSIYRGATRLQSAQESMNIIYSMQQFQRGFFDNGATFGMILTTDNTLSHKVKERTIAHWLLKYSPRKGGKRPVILDSGLKPHSVANNSFKDMDFDSAIRFHNEKILQALGVPPILLAGGNNANITPNLKLFYLETVLPIVRAYTSALERFFGYDIQAITSEVSALQPDLNEVAGYYSTLTNGGVITPNESRVGLRYPRIEDEENDKLRIPANIAGSAADPSQGGRPEEDKNE